MGARWSHYLCKSEGARLRQNGRVVKKWLKMWWLEVVFGNKLQVGHSAVEGSRPPWRQARSMSRVKTGLQGEASVGRTVVAHGGQPFFQS